jgi:hypothetical protein
MFRAFDLVFYDQPIGDMDGLMRAQAVSAEHLVVGRPEEGVGPAPMVETSGTLLFDVIEAASPDPIGHSSHP